MIGRRGFLLGTLTAAAGAGTALLTATPQEVAAFGKPLVGPVSLFQPEPEVSMSDPLGTAVFDREGRIIGFVSRMEVSNDMHDVTMRDDTYQSFSPGLLRVRYEVDGTGYTPLRFR